MEVVIRDCWFLEKTLQCIRSVPVLHPCHIWHARDSRLDPHLWLPCDAVHVLRKREESAVAIRLAPAQDMVCEFLEQEEIFLAVFRLIRVGESEQIEEACEGSRAGDACLVSEQVDA